MEQETSNSSDEDSLSQCVKNLLSYKIHMIDSSKKKFLSAYLEDMPEDDIISSIKTHEVAKSSLKDACDIGAPDMSENEIVNNSSFKFKGTVPHFFKNGNEETETVTGNINKDTLGSVNEDIYRRINTSRHIKEFEFHNFHKYSSVTKSTQTSPYPSVDAVKQHCICQLKQEFEKELHEFAEDIEVSCNVQNVVNKRFKQAFDRALEKVIDEKGLVPQIIQNENARNFYFSKVNKLKVKKIHHDLHELKEEMSLMEPIATDVEGVSCQITQIKDVLRQINVLKYEYEEVECQYENICAYIEDTESFKNQLDSLNSELVSFENTSKLRSENLNTMKRLLEKYFDANMWPILEEKHLDHIAEDEAIYKKEITNKLKVKKIHRDLHELKEEMSLMKPIATDVEGVSCQITQIKDFLRRINVLKYEYEEVECQYIYDYIEDTESLKNQLGSLNSELVSLENSSKLRSENLNTMKRLLEKYFDANKWPNLEEKHLDHIAEDEATYKKDVAFDLSPSCYHVPELIEKKAPKSSTHYCYYGEVVKNWKEIKNKKKLNEQRRNAGRVYKKKSREFSQKLAKWARYGKVHFNLWDIIDVNKEESE